MAGIPQTAQSDQTAEMVWLGMADHPAVDLGMRNMANSRMVVDYVHRTQSC